MEYGAEDVAAARSSTIARRLPPRRQWRVPIGEAEAALGDRALMNPCVKFLIAPGLIAIA